MAVFQAVDRRILTTALFADGSSIHPQTQVLRVEGPLRSILAARQNRTELLQRLSGSPRCPVAMCRRWPERQRGSSIPKTLPGFRFSTSGRFDTVEPTTIGPIWDRACSSKTTTSRRRGRGGSDSAGA